MGMEVVRQEPSALALISAGLGNRITPDHLAHLVAAQEAVSLKPSLLAPLHHLALLKPPALLSGRVGGFLDPRSRHQRVYSALQIQIQVPHSPAELSLIRLLKLDLVLSPVLLVAQREGVVLAVTHNKPNLIKEASHSVAQEYLTDLELLRVVQIPAVSLEADKAILALEGVNSNNNNNSKEQQILSDHLDRIGHKARLVPTLHLAPSAEINQHKN